MNLKGVPLGRKLAAGLALAAVLAGSGMTFARGIDPFGTRLVGRQANGSVLVDSSQFITPAGIQADLTGNPMTAAVRPDGQTAAVLNGGNWGGALSILDLATGKFVDTVSLGLAHMWGLAYSPDGSQLYASGSAHGTGQIVVLSVAADGLPTVQSTVTLPAAGVGGDINPLDVAVGPGGKTLLVALNRDNSLGVVDLQTGQLTARIPVGNAPASVVVDGSTAYVSNQGGRRALPGDFTNESSGTPIVASPVTGGSVTGTVSVVDLSSNSVVKTIKVGLQPTRMALWGRYLLVANTNSDTVSVVDTHSNTVVQTIDVRPYPGAPLGSMPNAVSVIPGPGGHSRLVVSLGRDDALAVYDWSGPGRDRGQAQPHLDGLVPTAWYPVDVLSDPAHGRLLVVNADGVGSLGPDQTRNIGFPATGHSAYAQVGSVSLVPLPTRADLAHYTDQVYADNNWFDLAHLNAPPRPGVRPVAMPQRLGEPSTIKHVFYIIKENRTYDQVLGDLGRGNGDPSLTQFGQSVSPNFHKLADVFPLLDNFYTSGIQSASGHQWADQATNPDYQEKETDSGNVRSYPFNGGDALTYASTGFLWNDALRHHRSVVNFGEYTDSFASPSGASFGNWTNWYNDAQILAGTKQGTLHVPVGAFQATSDVPSLNAITYHPYPGFNTRIPDQYRLQIFLQRFAQYVKDGNLPNLVIMTVPDDHTSGLASGLPTPQAAVADNDLATGRIVDAISHSRYWKDSAIFITEDDAQNGVDHVDGHREPAYVISPWVKRGIIDSHYWTMINMVRSMEQILGLPPMNQNDAAAMPMSEIFTNKPDFAPYNAVPNQIPLTTFNGTPQSTAATQVTPRAQHLAKLWTVWANGFVPSLTGPRPIPDAANANMENHAIWYGVKGFGTPYPGDAAALTPAQVAAQPLSHAPDPANNYS